VPPSYKISGFVSVGQHLQAALCAKGGVDQQIGIRMSPYVAPPGLARIPVLLQIPSAANL
jgi:hypothetical protein